MNQEILTSISIGVITFVIVAFVIFTFVNMLAPAPFVPTFKKTAKEMIKQAKLKPADIVYDLGCGDGKLIFMADKEGIKKGVGYELNPFLTFYAKAKSLFLRKKNLKFYVKSLWSADLKDCDKLFVYLMPPMMKKLESKVISEMKPGAMIISNSFGFPNLKPVHENKNVKVYKIEKAK